MAEKVIIFMCAVLCAVPFFLIGYLNRNSYEPIAFFSGDTTLKNRIADVKAYNRGMAKLYCTYAIIVLITGLISFINPGVAIVMLLIECTLGLLFLYFKYKNLLEKYRKQNKKKSSTIAHAISDDFIYCLKLIPDKGNSFKLLLFYILQGCEVLFTSSYFDYFFNIVDKNFTIANMTGIEGFLGGFNYFGYRD